MSETTAKRRRMRSFVRREGRMTPAQRRALESLWPRYGVWLPEGWLDLDALFGRAAPRLLEIGCGMGESLVAMAAAHPQHDYLAVEVYRPGIGTLLRRLEEVGLDNVRVIQADAVDVLEHWLPPASLAAVYVFFPDPWPKKRHHKRRLIQSPFLRLVWRVLQPGGLLHVVTDWTDYAEQIWAAVAQAGGFRSVAGTGRCAPRPPWRPQTKYEQRARRLGHPIHEIILERIDDPG